MSVEDVKVKHSSLGGSGAHRWMVCHGSVQAEKPYKVDIRESNYYADQGSAAHAINDRVLRNASDINKFLGQWFDPVLGNFNKTQKHNSHIEVDPEMIEHCTTFIQYVRGLAKSKDDIIMIEHTADLSSLHPDMFGTADASVYQRKDRHLYVIDFKYGQGIPVEATRNPQLMFYGLGILLEIAKKHPIDKVTLVVVQPRARHGEGPIRVYPTDPFELIEFGGDLIQAAKLTEVKNPKFEAGAHCKFCAHFAKCETAQQHALDVAAQVFEDEDVDMVGELLTQTYIVEDWIRAVRTAANALLQQGKIPTGWTAVDGKTHRRWAHEEKKIVAALKKKFKLSDTQLYKPRKLNTPAQIEKHIPKKEREQTMKLLAMRPRGKPTLARASDGRTLTDATDVFEEEE